MVAPDSTNQPSTSSENGVVTFFQAPLAPSVSSSGQCYALVVPEARFECFGIEHAYITQFGNCAAHGIDNTYCSDRHQDDGNLLDCNNGGQTPNVPGRPCQDPNTGFTGCHVCSQCRDSPSCKAILDTNGLQIFDGCAPPPPPTTPSPTTMSPTNHPTGAPTGTPITASPTGTPTTAAPSGSPTKTPTDSPSAMPTGTPTTTPTTTTTAAPTTSPTASQSETPSTTPTLRLQPPQHPHRHRQVGPRPGRRPTGPVHAERYPLHVGRRIRYPGA